MLHGILMLGCDTQFKSVLDKTKHYPTEEEINAKWDENLFTLNSSSAFTAMKAYDVVCTQFSQYPNVFIQMPYEKILKINKCIYPFVPGINNNNIFVNQSAMETTDLLQFLTQFELEVYLKIAKVFIMCNITLTVDDDLLAKRI